MTLARSVPSAEARFLKFPGAHVTCICELLAPVGEMSAGELATLCEALDGSKNKKGDAHRFIGTLGRPRGTVGVAQDLGITGMTRCPFCDAKALECSRK